MRAYSYRCHDFSLLTPSFKKWFVAPLLPLVPWGLPANIITIVSNGFVYLALYMALFYHGPLFQLIIAACLFVYLIGDHLDGMQAKKTNTGSALGEFCDHYLDAFNNGIILFTAFLVFEISNPILIGIVLATSYLAHMAVFYEQFKTGWITFEKLGSLEAVLLISFLIASSAISSVYGFLTTEILYSYRIIELLFLGSAVGALLTFLSTTSRTPNKGKAMWLFVLGLGLLTFLSINTFSGFQIFVLITLYSSLYIGQVMKGHLVDGLEQIPDLVIPSALLINQFIPLTNSQFAYAVLSLYLVVRIILLIIQTFGVLKIYWVWSNPRTSTK